MTVMYTTDDRNFSFSRKTETDRAVDLTASQIGQLVSVYLCNHGQYRGEYCAECPNKIAVCDPHPRGPKRD